MYECLSWNLLNETSKSRNFIKDLQRKTEVDQLYIYLNTMNSRRILLMKRYLVKKMRKAMKIMY